MKISLKKLFCSMGLFLFMLWAYTAAGLSSYIYSSTYAKIVTVLLGTALISLAYIVDRKRQHRRMGASDKLIVFIFFLVLYNNKNFAHENYSSDIAFFLILFSYFFLSRMGFWSDSFRKQIFIGGIIFGGITIACFFDRQLYEDKIWPLFVKENVYNDLLINYDKGYIAGLTNHVSSNGMYIAIACGVVACWTIIATKKYQNLFNKILLIALLFSLFLTGKRAHIIFTAAALFLVYWIYMSDKPKSRFVKGIAIILVVLMIFLVLAQFIPQLFNFVNKFIETANEGDVTKGRTNLVQLAIGRWRYDTVLGMGWDGFKYWYQSTTGILLNVHNVYIQVLCETGIVGAVIIYSFFAIEFLHCIKALSIYKQNMQNDISGNIKAISIACFIQAFFLFYCLTGNPLYDSQVLFPYVFSCAVGDYWYYELKDNVRNTYSKMEIGK